MALDRRVYEQENLNQELRSLFNYFDSYRKQYEDKAIDWYKQFVGYIEDKEEKKSEGKSNLHIPKTYEILDTIRSQIVMSFFDKRPYVHFSAMPQSAGNIQQIMTSKDKADIASAFVDEQLEKNNIRSTFYDFVTSMLIFPAAFMGVGWRYEEKEIRKKTKVPIVNQIGQYTGQWGFQEIEQLETLWDDNEVFNIDFFDFWGDPDATTIDDCRGVFHREWVTLEELANRLELLERIGTGIIYPVDFEKLSEKRKGQEGRQKRLSAVGIQASGFDPYSSTDDFDLEKKREVELLHYWEDDRHAILVNRDKVIYDGPNPYWRHHKKPFIKATYDQLPNEFYGLSAIQVIHYLQKEINTMHNQRMDNVNFLINNMWLRRHGSDIDDDQLVSRPNGIIDVNSPDDLQLLEKQEIPASAFNSEQKLNMDIERALGTPANVRGAESGKSQTATEASITAESAGARFNAKIALFEEMGIKRLAKLMDLNNQQFISDVRAARVNPEDRDSWQTVRPDDLIGEFDYSPATSSVEAAANKELRREQLTEILGFLMQAQVPFINYQKIVEEWLSEFDIDNPERFMIPAEEYEMIKQQVLQEISQMAGTEAMPDEIFMQAGQGGQLGAAQIPSPHRQGGMAADGTPQPQPAGNRGGA